MRKWTKSKADFATDEIDNLFTDLQPVMFTTVTEGGRMRSRPMLLIKPHKFDGTVWFLAADSSHIVAEINWNRQVHLNFCSSSNNNFTSITGTAVLIKNKEIIKKLWNPTIKRWLPNNIDLSEIALVKIQIEELEHWELQTSDEVKIDNLKNIA